LEISSPGEDRPFFKLSQFQRFSGQMVALNLYSPIDKRKKINGSIQGVEGDDILIQENAQIFRIPFQAISKARLIPEYLINKGGRNGK
jgi:ribosome maturation factor RimP